MGARPFVSIIIPTYNRAGMLGLTIDSFLAVDYPRSCYEIIVVDNNSSDHTAQVVKEYVDQADVSVRYFFEGRQGVHYARNSGALQAIGEYFYFTDDDMLADSSLLKELVSVFDLDSKIASATGMIQGRFDDPPPRWVSKYLINSWLSLTEKNKPEELVVSRHDMVYSCHQMIKRGPFFESGGYNPENTAGVWVGDGETGLGIKLSALGYKFAFNSRSIIYHMIPRSRTTLSYLVKRVGNQGYCDSYTAFRRHRKTSGIIGHAIRRDLLTYPLMLAVILVKVLLLKESWRFIPAKLMYIYRRNEYDFRLCVDSEFRDMALVDDWLRYVPADKNSSKK